MTDARELQFDRAEFSESAAPSVCTACKAPLTSTYFLVNGHMACEACRYRAETPDTSSGVGRFIRALGAGTAAAIGGALLYYAISAVTGYEFGLMAVVVGLAVGGAVKWGARGRGGWRYQALAMALTYLSIVGTYVPLLVKSVREHRSDTETGAPATAGAATAATPAPAPAAEPRTTIGGFIVAVVVLVGIVCALPFLAGFENIMGIVIIGIGLYEAWKINRRIPLTISGPHTIDAASVSAG